MLGVTRQAICAAVKLGDNTRLEVAGFGRGRSQAFIPQLETNSALLTKYGTRHYAAHIDSSLMPTRLRPGIGVMAWVVVGGEEC